MKPKVIVIVGPTASGKSDLAVLIAKEFDGEVISADSRQVYKGLNIGAGKITKREMCGVPHHMLDVLSPKKVFTVSDFKDKSEKIIGEIIERGKLPIICGGTGFYIDTLINNTTLPEVEPDPKLRQKLSKMSASKLRLMLLKLDSRRSKEIDPNNKVRLIRAIEIAKALGKVPQSKPSPNYSPLFIGIEWKREELNKRIQIRLLKRMKQGMLKEVENLHKDGLSWKRMFDLGLEYRYLSEYLQNKISKAEMLEKLEKEIEHYAKRQMTWFKRNKNIKWLNSKNLKTSQKIIRSFLKDSD